MSLSLPPRPNLENLQTLVSKHFGLVTRSARDLPGERDRNFCIDANDGKQYLLRFYRPDESIDFLRGQVSALQRLSDLSVPQWIEAKGGEIVCEKFEQGGNAIACFVGLMSWLDGKPWAQLRSADSQVPEQLGRLLGRMQQRWHVWSHPGLQRDFVWDLAQAKHVVTARRELITDSEQSQWIEKCLQRFERDVTPVAAQFRRGVIHNDANDYNVLVQCDWQSEETWKISGLIDFGDMLVSWTINDLAIAIAYAVLDEPRPLKVAAQIVRGYHQIWPLEEIEVAALWSLVTMRLATSICMSAEQQSARPDDPYLSISQLPIQRTLPRLLSISNELATAYLRWSIGWEAISGMQSVENRLREKRKDMQSLLERTWVPSEIAIIDWSIDSDLWSGDPRMVVDELQSSVDQVLHREQASLGTGGYGEPRPVYAGDQFIVDGQPFGNRRTIHLGLDLFAEAGTWIHAPLAGRVYRVAEIDAPFDYGGVVMLVHTLDSADTNLEIDNKESLQFYTVYGHLSRASVRQLMIGQSIASGEAFVQLGTADENGGWPPHLHLQLLVSDLGLGVDFPGVATADEWEFWRQISRDPNEIAQLPKTCLTRPEPVLAETQLRRQQYFGPSQRLSYRDPLHLVRGWRQYLFDNSGRRYLDAYNNVPHVGHAHPYVVSATCRQMQKLNTNTRYLSEVSHRYAEKLLSYFPSGLDTCFLLSSASEANELALRLARIYTGRQDLIVTEGAYHGHTNTLIDISPYKHRGPGGQGPPTWVHEVLLADDYRGPYRRGEPELASRYAESVQEILKRQQQLGHPVGAMIVETCPSVAGQLFFPPGYLTRVDEMVRQAGGLMIADEVQTGLGRLGNCFFAFERDSLVPDIVVLGKPIGNGHPLAAVITRREIAQAFDNGMEFFATFGGNTVSCAAGLAVLEVLEQEAMPQNAACVGHWIQQQFVDLAARYEIIGDVRGSGYFQGLELVLDRDARQPASRHAAHIVNRMRGAGILWGVDGLLHNVLKFRPPMCFDQADAEKFIECLDRELKWITG